MSDELDLLRRALPYVDSVSTITAVRRDAHHLAKQIREHIARLDPAHECNWTEHDGSRHCFTCRRTEHNQKGVWVSAQDPESPA